MSQLSDEINRFCRHTKFMIDELQSYIQSTNINSKNEFININNKLCNLSSYINKNTFDLHNFVLQNYVDEIDCPVFDNLSNVNNSLDVDKSLDIDTSLNIVKNDELADEFESIMQNEILTYNKDKDKNLNDDLGNDLGLDNSVLETEKQSKNMESMINSVDEFMDNNLDKIYARIAEIKKKRQLEGNPVNNS